ncbi:MAG: RNA polymerase sigma factor, partial [Lentisphaeraceae bacterium]|nr:RNA polymerase sigma factor [Lentisphaeraceae bacterium]
MSDEYQTRQSLLFRIKERYDESAWEDFVENYKNYIYKIIISFRVDKHDADDLMQTVLLKLWKKLPEFEYDPGKGKFRYWLGRVTKNFVFKFLNKKKRLGSEDDADDSSFEEENLDPEIHNVIEKEWRLFISEKAWANISPNFTEKVLKVFLMHADEIEFEQISEELDIEVSAAYVYRHRVQKALLKEIARLEFELG